MGTFRAIQGTTIDLEQLRAAGYVGRALSSSAQIWGELKKEADEVIAAEKLADLVATLENVLDILGATE